MNDQDLVTVARFRNPQEASISKGALDAEGIQAYLIGAEAATTLSYVGSAIGGVRLQVASDDSGQAKQVLATTMEDTSTAAWQCPACGSDVDAGFELCWSCGASPDQSASTGALPSPVDESDETSEAIDQEAEVMVTRLWRASVLGIALFPLLFYSLSLIFKLSSRQLSRGATWKYYSALVILSVDLVFYWILLRYGFGPGVAPPEMDF